jgi:hypothetical protein
MVFKLSTPTVIVEELNPLMVFKPSTPTVIVEELSPLMVFKQSTPTVIVEELELHACFMYLSTIVFLTLCHI